MSLATDTTGKQVMVKYRVLKDSKIIHCAWSLTRRLEIQRRFEAPHIKIKHDLKYFKSLRDKGDVIQAYINGELIQEIIV